MISSHHETGYAIHINEVLNTLRKDGYDVEVYIEGDKSYVSTVKNPIKSNKGMIERLRPYFPMILKNSIREIISFYKIKKQKKQIEEKIQLVKPDVIYERQAYANSNVAKLCNKYKIPLILESNCPLVEEARTFNRTGIFHLLNQKDEKYTLETATSVLSVSTALKNYYIEIYGINSEKIIVIPNAVNDSWFKDYKPTETHNKEKESLTVGFIGSFIKWHGIDNLVDVGMELLTNTDVNIEILLVGDGEERVNLENKVKSLNLEDSFKFTGVVNHKEIPNYIEKMDICVMPSSNWYGSPLKIFEYGALGKPIIAPKTDPVIEVMEDRVDGYLVGNKHELKSAIIEIISDYEQAKVIGNKFREKITKNYTWDKVGKKIGELITQIVEKGPI